MKGYVITIFDNEKSEQAAKRCIKSAAKHGLEVVMEPAITPEDSPMKIASNEEIPIDGFEEIYSRFDRCLSAFLSHYFLWKNCLEKNEPQIIFEHDAVVFDKIPDNLKNPIVNLGKPSYGKFRTPQTLGETPLVSKRYLPGAHAYYITPAGALDLINMAKKKAGPTDIFINLDYFPYINEYYPWPVDAKDNFTTIQNKNGCVAKHNYGETYEIL
jgi:hypothetical protein